LCNHFITSFDTELYNQRIKAINYYTRKSNKCSTA
jgi:hypothetical protein